MPMKGSAGFLALVALLVAGLVAAPTSTTAATPVTTVTPLGESATVALSSTRVGKRPVAVTLTLGYEMQCGYPGSGSLIVALPVTEQLPNSFPGASAVLNGRSVRLGFAAGKALRVTLPPRPKIMCDVIGPGSLKLVLTKAAKLGNPRKAGSYVISARVDGHSFRTSVRITA